MSIIDIALKIIRSIPILRNWLNRYLTNRFCRSTEARPRAFSLWSHLPKPETLDEQGPVGEYTTWPMLTDRKYSARHLPPASPNYINQLPEDKPYDPANKVMGDITALFARQDTMKEGRSSALFMFFAQWFTDSILRVDQKDRRKNTSNHNVDLCQIYGLTESTANILRSKERGKLKSQIIDGEEYLDYLGEIDKNGKWQVKEHYKALPYASDYYLDKLFGDWDEDRKYKLYATGLERGNSSVGYVAISTLFMREHNRICNELSQHNPSWDDERLFQTARMINIIILTKIVIEEYINHITGYKVFHLDPGFAEKQQWYRTPWIALEFNLLYRWHGLVPDQITIADTSYDDSQFRVNNALLEDIGLGTIIDAASKQRAGAISLQNVPTFMLGAEYAMVKMGRDFRLNSYNDYRKLFGLKTLRSFDQLCDNKTLQNTLQKLYGSVSNVELTVGLFAQSGGKRKLFGDLLTLMVAYDAFTQVYTNPLMSKHIYTARTLSDYGLNVIEQTSSLQDLVDRNIQNSKHIKASFE